MSSLAFSPMIGALPPNNTPTEEWVQSHVEWLYGFRLDPFQLDILMDLLGGGLFSVLLPTDHGKSTLLKMSVVLSLILNPKQPNMIIKISKVAAKQALTSIVFTLFKAMEYYPYVKPMVRMSRQTGLPFVSHEFMIEGGDFDRTDNPSVYAASIGEADLQGRRGRAHIDDIETEREGKYYAYRERLEGRVDSILRTIEDSELFLFVFFGTPQHGESIYFKIVDRLKALGTRFKVIRLPWKDPVTGALLMPRRANKIEIHRRTMTPWAFQVAYELEPPKTGRMDFDEIERSKDIEMPFCRTRAAFEAWFIESYENALAFLAEAHYYIGYDPSAEHEFAIAAAVYIRGDMYLLDAWMQPGDVFEQVTTVADMWERYGDPKDLDSITIVIERNGQQKAFRDVLSERLPNAHIEMHQTTTVKDSEKIGIPSMLQVFRNGHFHMPYADAVGRNVSDYLVVELQNYGPLAHPHLLPALWFTHYWHQKYAILAPIKARTEEAPTTYKIVPVQLDRARSAWGRLSDPRR